MHQAVKDTSKMPKEGKGKLSKQGNYGKQVNTNIGKEYVAKNHFYVILIDS